MSDVIASRTVTARDGLRLHAEGVGRPAAVMLHGLGYASWEANVLRPHLGAGLWSLDNRGTGRSATTVDDCSIEQLADDAAIAIEELGGPLTVIGHSMGGYIALTLALTRPDLVRSLVLIATSPGGPESTPVPASTIQAWTDAAGSPPAEYARATMPLSFRAGWDREHPHDFEQLLAARLAHPTSATVWQAQFSAAERYLRTGVDVRQIDVPTLVIHGADDRVVPVENGRLLAQRVLGAQYREIARGGHLVHLEDPRAVCRDITTFTSPTLT